MDAQLQELKSNIDAFILNHSKQLHDQHIRDLNYISAQLGMIELTTDKPLIIFDLNDVLIETVYEPDTNVNRPGWIRVGKSLRRLRDGCEKFIDFLFSEENVKKFRVAIWSSSYLLNVTKTIDGLLNAHKLDFFFVWGQERCEVMDNPAYKDNPKAKPQFFWKNLSEVWNRYPQYNETNTIIIDDNAQKLEKNPIRSCRVVTDFDRMVEIIKSI